jgi:glycerol kinase
LGAAFLAGLAVGVWPDTQAIAAARSEKTCYLPSMPDDVRDRLLAGWRRALAAATVRLEAA